MINKKQDLNKHLLHYKVSFNQANQHLFDVKLTIDFALQKGQKFSLPSWIPGSYMIRDFAKNIVTLNAKSNGNNIALTKTDKSSWQLNEAVDNLVIDYQVYAWDLSVRSAHLDNQHAFFNGTSLFLAVNSFEHLKHQVEVLASVHAKANHWIVATAMNSEKINASGFGLYQSDNYQDFIDHPFEIGALEKVSFEVDGVPHDMFFTEAPARVDYERIAKDVKQICETEVAFFGDKKPPFERYVFMTFVQKQGFGGLEHMASTALHCSFKDLPLINDNSEKISDSYRTFLSLCCHEYFHNWNVKRIKPKSFVNLDLSKESYTEQLWFFEGITSYYDELLLARAGVIDGQSYLDMLAQSFTRVYKLKGRAIQTVTESSFDAWTKFYKQDENAVNAIVSYYTKGAMVAFALDFEIRRLTKDQKSLDHLMQIIWNEHGKDQKGITSDEIKKHAEKLVNASMDNFFNQALYSTKELAIEKIFTELGINFQLLPQQKHNEKGGFVKAKLERKAVANLGITHKPDPLGVKVLTVDASTCGATCGLSSGDIIIAIDNIRVTSLELDKSIAQIPLGEKIQISYFRRERLYHVECLLTEVVPNIVYLSLQSEQESPELLAWLQS